MWPVMMEPVWPGSEMRVDGLLPVASSHRCDVLTSGVWVSQCRVGRLQSVSPWAWPRRGHRERRAIASVGGVESATPRSNPWKNCKKFQFWVAWPEQSLSPSGRLAWQQQWHGARVAAATLIRTLSWERWKNSGFDRHWHLRAQCPITVWQK